MREKGTTFVGLDVHKDAVNAARLLPGGDGVRRVLDDAAQQQGVAHPRVESEGVPEAGTMGRVSSDPLEA